MEDYPIDNGEDLLNITLKPTENGEILREAERSLLFAYIGEILEEIEVEEKRIIAEEKKAAREITCRKSKQEDKSCK